MKKRFYFKKSHLSTQPLVFHLKKIKFLLPILINSPFLNYSLSQTYKYQMKLSQTQSKIKRYYAMRIKTIEQFCAIFMLFTSTAGIGALEKNKQPKKQESISQIQEKRAFVQDSIISLTRLPL